MASKKMATVPKGWKSKDIGDLADLKNGSAFNEKHWKSQGVPIIRIQNLNGGKEFNYYEGDTAKCVTIESGDLLFSWSGNRGTSFGPFVWSGPAGVLNQHIFKVTAKNGVGRDFLYQALLQVTEEIERTAHGGTGIVHVKKSDLESFSVLVPPPSQQECILKILNSVDEAIEATRAVIDQTRRLKTALLQDLLTNGLPGRHKKFKSLPSIGRIPADWEVIRIGDLGHEDRPVLKTGPFGAQLKSEYFTDTGVPVLNIGNVQPGLLDLEQLDHIDEERALLLKDYAVEPGDLIFSRSATIGRTACIPPQVSGWLISYHLIRLSVDKTRCDPHFLMRTLMDSPAIVRQIEAVTQGGTRAGVNTSILSALKVPVPPLPEQTAIGKAATVLDQRIGEDLRVLEQLTTLKSALSQGLLTGRIPVKGAE